MPEKNEDNDLEQELSYCGKLEKEIESDEVLRSLPKVKEKLNLLRETIEDIQDHYTLSKDPDARTGHKTVDTSFFGFKTHIAMTEERIITAAVVTSADKGDGPELLSLLEASQENGIEVDTIIGDAAYSGKENLKLAGGQEIKVVAKLNPSITQGIRQQENTFDYNKDAASSGISTRFEARGSSFCDALCKLCIEVCVACATECEKHSVVTGK